MELFATAAISRGAAVAAAAFAHCHADMASKGKGIGGFLKAQASSKIKPTTEDELLPKKEITPDDVLGLSKPCRSVP